jgi:hypothetical protein
MFSPKTNKEFGMPSTAKMEETDLSTDQNELRLVLRQLHQTTQPLSVLQGVLELSLIQARTAEEYRRAVVQALQEVNRVSDCFDELRRQIGQWRQSEASNCEPGDYRV